MASTESRKSNTCALSTVQTSHACVSGLHVWHDPWGMIGIFSENNAVITDFRARLNNGRYGYVYLGGEQVSPAWVGNIGRSPP
mgnify:CR=1 FL=1